MEVIDTGVCHRNNNAGILLAVSKDKGLEVVETVPMEIIAVGAGESDSLIIETSRTLGALFNSIGKGDTTASNV